MFKNPTQVFDFIEKEKIEFVDFKLTNLFGKLHHLTIPAKRFSINLLEEGIGFDGSSYGFLTVEKSDMVFIPDITSAFIDPFTERATLSMFAKIYQITPEGLVRFDQDPRYILEKTCDLFKSKGIADTLLFLPEFEFYIFDSIQIENLPDYSCYSIESAQGNMGGNKGFNTDHNGYYLRKGYHADQPSDRYLNFRNELTTLLIQAGIDVKYHHLEVGAAGQVELELDMADVQKHADATIIFKYFAKNLAKKLGYTLTFMPKPLYNHAGSGFHVHIQLLKNNENVFYSENGYSGLSETALNFIGGILKHARSLSGFTNPTTNSYRRLVKGHEAPTSIVFAESNRSSAIRIPGYARSSTAKRIEYRPQDATCNPYFAFSALLLSGMDGVLKKIDPTAEGFGPYDVNIYENNPELKIQSLPQSLTEALNALKIDREYLLPVFPDILIENWIHSKFIREVEEINLRPHPYEFELYYDM